MRLDRETALVQKSPRALRSGRMTLDF